MKFFADQEALDRELAGLKSALGPQLGLVSSEAPLISNLDVWSNIALIYQYHQAASKKNAQSFVLQCLQRYGLENIANKKDPELSDEERFCVKILRAAMVVKAVIVVDRPFKMLHYHKDISFVDETLTKIDDLFERCDILDFDPRRKISGECR